MAEIRELVEETNPASTDLFVMQRGTDDAKKVQSANAMRAFSSSVRTFTGTTDTPSLDDNNGYIRGSNAAAITVTIPPNSSVAFPLGTSLTYRQAAAGQLEISPGSGVTLNAPASASSPLKTKQEGSTVQLVKVATDEWDIFGDLETP